MSDEPKTRSGTNPKAIILVAVAVVFAVIVGFKLGGAGDPTVGSGAPETSGAVKISEVRGDANAAYEAALASGKPVYVLFHSLSCQPCIEISAVVEEVVPEYEGKLVFVNAISDDSGSAQLASKFQFQYIPSSFFVSADGKVRDSYTGALTAEQMRAKLDALVAE